MPRNIPIALQSSLQRGITTWAWLLRIDPTMPGFPSLFVTGLDRNIDYDDGDGIQTYLAAVGYQPSTMTGSADLSVAGGEFSGLLPEYDLPVSEADLVSGAYDFAQFTAYQIDYENPTPGDHIILGHGTTGRNTITDGGLAFMSELRGLAQALKQSITEKWSLGCRATFGSVGLGLSTSSGEVEERYPCNFDAEALWEPGTVESVGAENTRSFTTTGLAPVYGGVPGMVRWTTGANAGRTYEAEGFVEDSGGEQTIGLTFPTMFQIQIGDTFEFRDDCPHTPEACKARNNWQNYRGESTIPVADDGQISTPGAQAGIGTGGQVQTDIPEALP